MKKLTQGNQFICPKCYSSRILASTVRIFPVAKQPALDLVQFSCMIDLSSASAHKAVKNFLWGKTVCFWVTALAFPSCFSPSPPTCPRSNMYPCVHFPVHLFLQPLKTRLLFLHAPKLVSQLETLCSVIMTIDLSGPISFSLEFLKVFCLNSFQKPSTNHLYTSDSQICTTSSDLQTYVTGSLIMILAPGVFLFLLLQMDSVDLSDPVEDFAMWKSESPTQILSNDFGQPWSRLCPRHY